MKNKTILILLTFLIGISCQDDFFELERPPQNPWTTLEDFEAAAIGAYGVLFSDREWVQAWPNYAVTMTTLGDDVTFVNDERWGYWRNTNEGSELTERNWWLLYRGIGAVNVALDYVEEHNGNPYPEADAEDISNNLDRLVGELHFLRGFCYYLLQTTYGHAYDPSGSNATPDLPIHRNFVGSASEAINPQIGTTQEVWDFILEDFNKANELLPDSYNTALHHPSFEVRANRFAALGMLARTHFQRGEYKLAKQFCSELIDQNNGNYDLMEEPIEAFNKSGYAERGREVIWYLPYSDATLFPPSHLSVLNTTWNGQKCKWNETRMSHTAIQQLGWMDNPESDTTINEVARSDKRFQQLIQVWYPKDLAGPLQEVDDRPEVENITTIWPNKYYRGPNQDFTNVPLLRLAEFYLTRSIIRLQQGDLNGAADDLNVVRERAWDETVGGEFVPVTASEITAEMIHNERLIELFNEADRVNYLRGLKMDIPLGDRGEGVDTYDSEKFIWAIPEFETLYNDGL
ncbi:MAG: RagB/SusD family nutrient uptake outer membrane protein [Bacteroidota bacterium]